MSHTECTLGKRIIKERESRDITQRKLAAMIGVDQTTVSRYERGTVTHRIEILNDIAIALRMTQQEHFRFLVGDTNE